MFTLLVDPALSDLLSGSDTAVLAAIFARSFPDLRGTISISEVDDILMQELNREHRGRNTTTDVLSFHYVSPEEMISDATLVGDIIFSRSRIISQAVEHAHSQKEETGILTIHSLLHLIGYDHETEEDFAAMWQYELPMRNAWKKQL